MPNVNMLHCDLKLENLMLKSEHQAGIKVIDFGSACFAND